MRHYLLNAALLLLPIVGVSLDKWAPSSGGVRDPRDPAKRSGMFWNWPRYLKFGGAPHAPMQAGTKSIDVKPGKNQDAAGPISDRGRGR